jgi:multiple sugar transport system permease protein
LCTGTGIFVPIVRSVGLSLFNVRLAAGGTTTSWAGLGNFAAVIRNGSLVRALRVTVIFAGSVVVGMFVVGLALALLLNVRIKGQRVLRSLALLPWVTPTIITALLWSWIFQPQYGLANYLLSSLGLISRPIAWTADLTWALPAVMIAALWRDLPFMFLMLLAGLQAIPTEMYEAARIDGAGPVVSFTRITLPFLRNVIKTTVLLAIINNFKQFPLFWTMTGGGPVDRTTTLAVLTYKEAFVDLSFGRAAAVSTAWLGLLVVFSLAYTRLFRGMERE